MTIQNSCFWSLLSLDKLVFIHIPLSIGKMGIDTENDQTTVQDVLLHRSLFEFMHPNEIEMAKDDLSGFLKLKTLAGSVTRCRLLSLKSMACHVMSQNSSLSSIYQDWNIIDLVIYTATDDTVLAFFHNTDFGSCHFDDGLAVSNPSCSVRSDKPCFDYQDASHLIQVLKLIQRTPMMPISEEHHLIDPVRIFQIVDPNSLKPLFVWPQLYSFVDMVQSLAKQIVLREFKNPSSATTAVAEDASCSRHFYANSKIELFITKKACNFQRILIPYGNILFESIQVSPIPINTPIVSSIFGGQPSEVDTKLALTFQHESIVNKLIPYAGARGPEPQPYQQTISSGPGPATTVFSPSLHLRKFRIQQHPQQELAMKQQSFMSLSTEKKRRNVFYGSGSTTSTPPDGTKICTRCHTSNSPEWRRGPDGHKTLCNACGLRYSRFRSKQWRTTATNTSTASSSSSSPPLTSSSTPK